MQSRNAKVEHWSKTAEVSTYYHGDLYVLRVIGKKFIWKIKRVIHTLLLCIAKAKRLEPGLNKGQN